MTDRLPQRFDPNAPLFTVTVAARLADMHPQTLRGYDRQGLVVPTRTRGRGRRYSLRDVARLRRIQKLSQEDGVNLEGIRRILELEEQLEIIQEQVNRLAEMLELTQQRAEQSRTFTVASGGIVRLGRTARRDPIRAIESGR